MWCSSVQCSAVHYSAIQLSVGQPPITPTTEWDRAMWVERLWSDSHRDSILLLKHIKLENQIFSPSVWNSGDTPSRTSLNSSENHPHFCAKVRELIFGEMQIYFKFLTQEVWPYICDNKSMQWSHNLQQKLLKTLDVCAHKALPIAETYKFKHDTEGEGGGGGGKVGT